MTDEHGKSDGPIVPRKPTNEAGQPAEEPVEGRGSTKGNSTSKTRTVLSDGKCAPSTTAS